MDVSDLGILAANYGLASGATWSQGDFNADGRVDVGDLGILAGNYGTGAGAALDCDDDGHGREKEDTAGQADRGTSQNGCGLIGLALIVGMGLVINLELKRNFVIMME